MLILAIFSVVLLSVLAVGISSGVRIELGASRLSLERMQGLFLAEAAIRQARAVLLYDDPKLDTLQDPWGPDCAHPLDAPRAFGEGFYLAHIEDACPRANRHVLCDGPRILNGHVPAGKFDHAGARLAVDRVERRLFWSECAHARTSGTGGKTGCDSNIRNLWSQALLECRKLCKRKT